MQERRAVCRMNGKLEEIEQQEAQTSEWENVQTHPRSLNLVTTQRMSHLAHSHHSFELPQSTNSKPWLISGELVATRAAMGISAVAGGRQLFDVQADKATLVQQRQAPQRLHSSASILEKELGTERQKQEQEQLTAEAPTIPNLWARANQDETGREFLPLCESFGKRN